MVESQRREMCSVILNVREKDKWLDTDLFIHVQSVKLLNEWMLLKWCHVLSQFSVISIIIHWLNEWNHNSSSTLSQSHACARRSEEPYHNVVHNGSKWETNLDRHTWKIHDRVHWTCAYFQGKKRSNTAAEVRVAENYWPESMWLRQKKAPMFGLCFPLI